MSDPLGQFVRLNALMRHGGLVCFTTPDEGSYLARLQGRRWRCFIPPIHVTNFNLRAVDELLDQTGFEPLLRSIALPWEPVLKRWGVIGFFKKIKFSDKMMIMARKVKSLD